MGSNFGPYKSTAVERNFGLSKITIVDRNFGPSKTKNVDRYLGHPRLRLWTVILNRSFFLLLPLFSDGTVAVGKLRAV